MSIADKLTAVAENMPAVYDSGKISALGDFYDLFWDSYQQNGQRTAYTSAFRGGIWTKDSFKPKYDIIPQSRCEYMFYGSNIEASLPDILSQRNVTLDFSKCTRLVYTFQNSKFTRVGTIDTRSITDNQFFYVFTGSTELVTIDNIILHEENNGAGSWGNMFYNCPKLENVTLTGGGRITAKCDLSRSPRLSKASITNIINYLGDEGTGNELKLNLNAVKRGFETTEGAMDGNTSEEWLSLAGTKTNWTISLMS